MKVFHNPKLKIIDYMDERFYTLDGIKFYPSSTTILSVYPKGYGFNEYLKKLGYSADEELRKAGEQGTKIHKAIQNYLNGEQVTWVDPENREKYGSDFTINEWIMISRFVEFHTKYKPEALAVELSLLDEELGFGCTIDYVGIVEGEIWLIDWKSSNYIHKNHYLQIASNIALWNRKYPNHKIQRFAPMHLKASTRGESKKKTSIQGKGWQLKEGEKSWHDYYKVFDHCKAIWTEENPNYIPKNEQYPDAFQIKKEVKKLTEEKGTLQVKPPTALPNNKNIGIVEAPLEVTPPVKNENV